MAGVLLRGFDRPLIIDELNRCDIDKVIGPLFTVLSGQQTTLPYRVDIANPESDSYVILPESKIGAAKHEFAPGPAWRIIATINSIDKASLYQMSYALSRRFGWIYVDAPGDPASFIRTFLRREEPDMPEAVGDQDCPLAGFWSAMNTIRRIGPSPIVDAIRIVRQLDSTGSFFGEPGPEMRRALLDAVDMVLLPLLDGISSSDAALLSEQATNRFQLAAEESARVMARFEAIAV